MAMRRLKCVNPQGHYSTYVHKFYREGEITVQDADFPDYHFDEIDDLGRTVKEAACRKDLENMAVFGAGVKRLPPATIQEVEQLCQQKDFPLEQILATYDLKDLAFLPKAKATEIISLLKRMKDVDPAPEEAPAQVAAAKKP